MASWKKVVVESSAATIAQNTTGNAATATTASQASTLVTPRAIALSGDVTGTANFDGSADITISATVVDDSHNHIIGNVDGLQTALDGKQDADADLTAIAGLSSAYGNFIVGSATGWVAESGATARTSLGLGSLATKSTIVTGDITNGTILEVDLSASNSPTAGQILSYNANGGFTWVANTAAANNAQITLTAGAGLAAIGDGAFTLNQSSAESFTFAVDGVLEDLDTLGPATAADTFIVSSAAGTFAYQTAAQVKATLDLEIGTDVQAYDSDLTTLAGLSSADGNFIVGSASGWTVESGATARTSLGLGDASDVTFNDLTLTGDLTVQGTVTTLDSNNVTIKDQFIFLADTTTGADVDGGIVVQQADNDAAVFAWDTSVQRWGAAYGGGSSGMSALTPIGHVPLVHGGDGNSSNATAALAQIGNMYIDTNSSTGGSIYIYS